MFGTVLFLLLLGQMWKWAKALLSLLFYLLFTLPLLFNIFDKRAQNLWLNISTLSFMNDGLFISQEKSYEKSNENLFCSYSIISSLFKHKKSEIFHFSRSTKNFNPSSLDCGLLGGSILWPKKNQRYLGFIFNRKLSFWQHICFYSNKALLTRRRDGIVEEPTFMYIMPISNLLEVMGSIS